MTPANSLPSATLPLAEARRDEAELKAARDALHRRIEHLFRRCELEADSGAQTLFKAVLDYRLEALR